MVQYICSVCHEGENLTAKVKSKFIYIAHLQQPWLTKVLYKLYKYRNNTLMISVF